VHHYLEVFASCLKEAALFNVVGAATAVGALVFFDISLFDSFGFIVLIESTGLMLVGGALGVSGGATARKVAEFLSRKKLDERSVQSSDAKATLYAVTGIILFAEGALMSAILG